MVGSKRRMGVVVKKIFDVHITNHHHCDADCRGQHKQGNAHANVATAHPSYVGMYSALDLPEQDNKPEHPYIAFSTTVVTSTTVSTETEKGT